MSRVNGFFTFHSPLQSAGLVWGRIGFISIAPFIEMRPTVDIVLEIDTGSNCTILLDNDFLQVCKSSGWKPSKNPDDIVNWIRTQPNRFNPIGELHCIAGNREIYRIESSYLQLLRKDLRVPSGWKPQSPLYGTFSTNFLGEDIPDDNCKRGYPKSHRSILGRDKINEYQELLWSRPNKTIKLSG